MSAPDHRGSASPAQPTGSAAGARASRGTRSHDGPDLSGPIDSHCHLQSLPPEERERALDAARERGVRGFLVPATRLEEAEDLLAFCYCHPDVWCALGVHPHEASSWQNGDVDRLRSLLADPRAVAVGECGLDFYYDHSPREAQFRALREQWALAIELGLPVVVHNRDSNEEMLAVVREEPFRNLTGDFHSFAGGLAMARELIERGFYLGLSGMITFPKADNVREVIPILPPDRCLVETDTPYLAPVPYRGKPNRPAYVVEIAERLAKERGESFEQVCRRTGENFYRLFWKAGAVEPKSRRILGQDEELFKVPEDFNAPLPDDLQSYFESRNLSRRWKTPFRQPLGLQSARSTGQGRGSLRLTRQ